MIFVEFEVFTPTDTPSSALSKIIFTAIARFEPYFIPGLLITSTFFIRFGSNVAISFASEGISLISTITPPCGSSVEIVLDMGLISNKGIGSFLSNSNPPVDCSTCSFEG